MPRLRRWLELVPEHLTPKELALLPEEITVVLVSAKRIGQLHAVFLDDPAPTDVITFQHGDIVVCPEVADDQRRCYQRSLEHETLLYMIHGIMHLAGYDDKSGGKARRMAQRQEDVLAAVVAAGDR